MKKVRNAITKGEGLVAELRRQQKAIESEGRKDDWTATQRKAAAEAAAQHLKEIKAEALGAAIDETSALEKIYNSHLKPGGITSGEKTFTLQDAQGAFQGASLEKAINIYRHRVGGLDADEKRSRWIWDRQLRQHVHGDPAYAHAAEKVIDEFRSVQEKSAHRKLQVAKRIRERLPTLTAQLDMKLSDAINGEPEPTGKAKLDLAALFDQIIKESESKE